MKLLMENWRKFINEAEESADLEHSLRCPLGVEEKIEKRLEKIFNKHPDLAEKVLEKSEDGGEESVMTEVEEKALVSSKLEDIFMMSGLFGGVITLLTMCSEVGVGGEDYEPSSASTAALIGGLGVAAASSLLWLITKKAREALEKRGVNLPGFLKGREMGKSGEDNKELQERKLTSYEKKKKEKIVKGMKSSKKDFEKRYPGRGEEVMYATAAKEAKRKRRKRG